jgi:hypothetical protein
VIVTFTYWLPWIAIVTSAGSLAVAISAKRQARMTAALETRKEAINHVRGALQSLARGNKYAVRDVDTLDDLIAGIRTSPAQDRVQAAHNISALVFSRGVTTELDRVVKKMAVRDRQARNGAKAITWEDVTSDLEGLIPRMNNEATLRSGDVWRSLAWPWRRRRTA